MTTLSTALARRKRRGMLPLAIGTGVALLALTACSGASAPGASGDVDTVTVEYTMPDVFKAPISDIVAQAGTWSPQGPKLKAEVVGSSYNDLTQRVQADASTGSGPEIALVPINRVPNFVEQGIAQPLDTLLDAEHIDLSGIDPAAMNLAKVKGKQYAVPFALSAPMLYYNADLFTKAGLDPAKPPTTWAEVAKAAKALTDKAAGRHGIVYQWDQDQWVFQSQVNSAGGTMLTGSGKVAFNDPAGVKALQYWVDLARSGSFPPLTSTPNPDDQTAFTQGKLGMWVGSSAFAASVTSKVNFDVRTTTFPTETGSPTKVAAGGAALIVLTKDAQKQKLAAKALAKFATPQASTILTKATGYLPINKEARDSSKYLSGFLAGQPLRRPAIAEIPRLEQWTTYPGSRSVEISETITKELQYAMNQKKSARQALDDAAKTVTPLIGTK
ncbi:extracellular solute-binding protein [Streptomyces sp. NPDC093085]|uniref:extracellular solute-binding protein n=1 Tax=Streptomyces sp. NPDC093085 TaxID=3155068 RepID=UPI0034379CF4